MAPTPRLLTFHFTLRDASGRVLDTSRGGEPKPLLEGAGQVIDGLEEPLRQMAVGERRELVVPPGRGYGARDALLVQKVPRAWLPVTGIGVGDRFQTAPDPQAPVVTVVAIEGEDIVLDANHPLAGQELHFEIELVGARPATAAEIAAAAPAAED